MWSLSVLSVLLLILAESQGRERDNGRPSPHPLTNKRQVTDIQTDIPLHRTYRSKCLLYLFLFFLIVPRFLEEDSGTQNQGRCPSICQSVSLFVCWSVSPSEVGHNFVQFSGTCGPLWSFFPYFLFSSYCTTVKQGANILTVYHVACHLYNLCAILRVYKQSAAFELSQSVRERTFHIWGRGYGFFRNMFVSAFKSTKIVTNNTGKKFIDEKIVNQRV